MSNRGCGTLAVVIARWKLVLRTLRRLTTDPRLPRPVRWLLAIGLLPIPGPVDEAALALAVALLFLYRRRVREILTSEILPPPA